MEELVAYLKKIQLTEGLFGNSYKYLNHGWSSNKLVDSIMYLTMHYDKKDEVPKEVLQIINKLEEKNNLGEANDYNYKLNIRILKGSNKSIFEKIQNRAKKCEVADVEWFDPDKNKTIQNDEKYKKLWDSYKTYDGWKGIELPNFGMKYLPCIHGCMYGLKINSADNNYIFVFFSTTPSKETKKMWKDERKERNNVKESIDLTNISDFNQEEYDQGYADALKTIQSIQRAIANGGMESDNGSGGDIGDDIGQNDVVDGSQLTPAKSDADLQFGGNDLISTDMAQEIAEEAGQPYDMEDIKNSQNIIKNAEEFVDKNRSALENIGEKTHGRGGSTTKSMLDKIDSLFKPVINWKAMLKHFLNTIGKKGIEPHYSRRMLGTTNPDLQDGKYIKYKDKPYYEKSGVAQVFHLIDGSGSMGSAKGPIFQQIFGEIIDMSKKAHIQKSAVAYFGASALNSSNIRMWDEKTNKSTVLEYINRHANDDGGGTAVYRAIKSLEDMGKPYFSTRKPNTLLLIYTDGEDDYSHIKEISPTVLNNMVWLILNTSDNYINNAINEIEGQGVKRSRILGINLNKIK